MNVTPIGGQAPQELELGCLARDIVTGYEGICVATMRFIDGSAVWTLEQRTGKGNQRQPTESFPEGRVERIGDGICKALHALNKQRGK